MQKIKHFMYMPLLGLGLYNGYRGANWLRNRVRILKQFVVPSLLNQTSKNFTLWISVRYEDRLNPQIKELKEYFDSIKEFKTVFTYSGVCFWDDKYPDDVAKQRLTNSLHGSMGELINEIGDAEYVAMTIQPSDDLYHADAVKEIQEEFAKNKKLKGVGYKHGYISNYLTKEVNFYNPTTNPPFYTIKFPREVFTDPFKHLEYTGIKHNYYNTKYPSGTPLPSHEYLRDVFGDDYKVLDKRGFLVGTHSVNISTTWQIPFKGETAAQEVLRDFGIYDVPLLKIKIPLTKRLYLLFPFKVQRKIRYWLTEKFK